MRSSPAQPALSHDALLLAASCGGGGVSAGVSAGAAAVASLALLFTGEAPHGFVLIDRASAFLDKGSLCALGETCRAVHRHLPGLFVAHLQVGGGRRRIWWDGSCEAAQSMLSSWWVNAAMPQAGGYPVPQPDGTANLTLEQHAAALRAYNLECRCVRAGGEEQQQGLAAAALVGADDDRPPALLARQAARG